MSQLAPIPTTTPTTDTASEERPRPGSRADRMHKPLAKDALKQLAEQHGVCVRPWLCAEPTPPPA